MASRGLMLSFLKNSIQHNLRSQPAVKGLVVRNSPCIANVVYRKLSSSLVRKGDAEKVELRTQEEITKYVKEETDKVNFSYKVSSYAHSFMILCIGGSIKMYICTILRFQNWVGFGAYPWDRFKDNVYGNIAFFCVAITIVFPVFFYNYMPDYQ